MRTTSSVSCFLGNKTLRMSDITGKPSSGYNLKLMRDANKKRELCPKIFKAVMQSIYFNENAPVIAKKLGVPTYTYRDAINGNIGKLETLNKMLDIAESWERRPITQPVQPLASWL